MLSPKMLEEFILTYIKKANEELLETSYKHICCHLCGEQKASLVHRAKMLLVAAGIINIGHEVELKTGG